MTEQPINYLAIKVWVYVKELTIVRAHSFENQDTLASDIAWINTTSKE